MGVDCGRVVCKFHEHIGIRGCNASVVHNPERRSQEFTSLAQPLILAFSTATWGGEGLEGGRNIVVSCIEHSDALTVPFDHLSAAHTVPDFTTCSLLFSEADTFATLASHCTTLQLAT